MAIAVGSDFTLEVSDDGGTTWTFVEDLNNIDDGSDSQIQSFPRFHAATKFSLPAQRETTLSIGGMYNPADAGQTILWTADGDSSEIDVRVTYAQGTPDLGFTQTVRVGSTRKTGDPDSPITFTMDLAGSTARTALV